jgi:riboflavin biosynthesis pyrimidine reductase
MKTEVGGKRLSNDDPWAPEVLPPLKSEPVTVVCDTEGRLDLIRESSDVLWLRKVLAWPDNQVIVRAAAERRLRKLQRARILS